MDVMLTQMALVKAECLKGASEVPVQSWAWRQAAHGAQCFHQGVALGCVEHTRQTFPELNLVPPLSADAVERYMPDALRSALEDLQDVTQKYQRRVTLTQMLTHTPQLSAQPERLLAQRMCKHVLKPCSAMVH